jgi:cytochrome c553
MRQTPSAHAVTVVVAVAMLAVAAGVAADRAAGEAPEGFRITGDAEAGETLFRRSCAACHGAKGSGDGAVRLPDVEMPDLRDRLTMTSGSDWEIYRIIADGGEATGRCAKMLPAGHRFDEAAIQDLAAYVKTLPARAYVERNRDR